jgi:hypothetical protein
MSILLASNPHVKGQERWQLSTIVAVEAIILKLKPMFHEVTHLCRSLRGVSVLGMMNGAALELALADVKKPLSIATGIRISGIQVESRKSWVKVSRFCQTRKS